MQGLGDSFASFGEREKREKHRVSRMVPTGYTRVFHEVLVI